MRPLFAGLALGSVLLAASAGCSFLIAFDDQPSCDGGLCQGGEAGAAADAPAEVDAGVDADPRKDAAADAKPPPPKDAGPDAYDPCNGVAAGAYCATDQLKGWAGPPNDLVHCAGNAVATVDLCDGGCLSMPNPFPDTCSGCPDKADGTYCGRDIPAFPHGAGGDDDFLIGCQAGNVTTNYPCPHGCKSNGAAASCFP